MQLLIIDGFAFLIGRNRLLNDRSVTLNKLHVSETGVLRSVIFHFVLLIERGVFC